MKKNLLLTLILGICLAFSFKAKAGGAGLTITMGPEFEKMILAITTKPINPTVGLPSEVIVNLSTTEIKTTSPSTNEATSNPTTTSNTVVIKKNHQSKNNYSTNSASVYNENNSAGNMSFQQNRGSTFDHTFMNNPANTFQVVSPDSRMMQQRDHSMIQNFLANQPALTIPNPFRVPIMKLHTIPNRDLQRKKRLSLHS